MTTQVLLWLENALIALLLIRALRKKFLTKYLLLYLYLGYELANGLVGFYVYTLKPDSYLVFYWSTRFLSVVVGYCVTWEIYTHVFRDYSGTAKMARCAVSTFFIAVLNVALVNAFAGEGSGLIKSVIGFERNLRAVQAVLLSLLLALIWYYAIPLGRNLGGLLLGYGFFIGVGVITLTLRSYLGTAFQLWWQYLQQMSYLAALMIWVPALWSYAPNPKADNSIGLEEDYAVLAERTYRAITRARDSVLRAFQS